MIKNEPHTHGAEGLKNVTEMQRREKKRERKKERERKREAKGCRFHKRCCALMLMEGDTLKLD